MAIEIAARKREAQGTGASRRLRRQGKVPGILYGGDKSPINIELEHQELFLNLRNEKIHMKVPLHFVNAEKSPGVKEQGGVVNHVLNELDIVCFPDDLPEFVEVDLGSVSVGHSLHVRELTLP